MVEEAQTREVIAVIAVIASNEQERMKTRPLTGLY
jgi:hypothetical protein